MRNRLEVFKASTAPVLDFYREKGILADFQGTESKKIVLLDSASYISGPPNPPSTQ